MIIQMGAAYGGPIQRPVPAPAPKKPAAPAGVSSSASMLRAFAAPPRAVAAPARAPAVVAAAPARAPMAVATPTGLVNVATPRYVPPPSSPVSSIGRGGSVGASPAAPPLASSAGSSGSYYAGPAAPPPLVSASPASPSPAATPGASDFVAAGGPGGDPNDPFGLNLPPLDLPPGFPKIPGSPLAPPAPPPEPSSSTGLYIGIGAAAVAVGVGIFLVTR